MNGVALPVLILVNLVIAVFSGSMLFAPGPRTASVVASGPPSTTSPVAAVGRAVDEAPDATTGNTMFGTSGVSEKRKADKPTPPSSQPSTDDILLLGILMVQEGADRQSVVALMRHGRPPVVSRQKIGDIVDGWSLASATRNTVRLSRPDGAIRFLQIDRKAGTAGK